MKKMQAIKFFLLKSKLLKQLLKLNFFMIIIKTYTGR